MILLVAGAFGPAPWSPELVLWVLFPVFSVVGYPLFATPARTAQVRGFTFMVSCLLLLLPSAQVHLARLDRRWVKP